MAPYVLEETRGAIRVIAGSSLSIAELRRRLSQRDNRYTWEHLGVSELVSDLLDRSRTNASLALELINRPELENRIDAFVLLFATAWEQLLKAKLEIACPGIIFEEAAVATTRRTIGLSAVLEKVFPSKSDPVRRNIEVLKRLRDDAAHLLVPEILGAASRYFQASLLNYDATFSEITGESPFRFHGTGLLTLGVAYERPRIEVIRARHGSSAEEISALIGQLEKHVDNSTDSRFAVSLEYELILEKKPGPNAIKLVKADENGLDLKVVKVPRDPKATCPYSATDVAGMLTERTGNKWTASQVGTVAKFLGVHENDNHYHYAHPVGRKNVDHKYSKDFIDLIMKKLSEDPDLKRSAHNAAQKKA